jgi:pimeloyl-ACP methyl ester carboxylesterase
MRRVYLISAALIAAQIAIADDGSKLVRIDHYVGVKSTVPIIEGQTAQIYVREVALAGTVMRGAVPNDRVVLFIHGAGTPAEVSFDVPYQDYSWMEFLARAGFDVFSMDTTGYGRSTRPAPMNDPCNLSREQQAGLAGSLIPAPCSPSYAHQLTTIASDWNDIGAVVDHVRALRHADKLSLIAWSLGGPRAGGFAAQHPEKVRSLVLLAPAYNRGARGDAPEKIPADGPAFNKQSLEDFNTNWDRQVGCVEQYERGAHDAVWKAMLESDPVGATWGTGVRRAPSTTVWGWSNAAVTKMKTPTLMVSGAHDKQVPPERVRDLYADLGSPDKVFVDLACSSHNAMWEKNHLLLFTASLDWLEKGAVKGAHQGEMKLGY